MKHYQVLDKLKFLAHQKVKRSFNLDGILKVYQDLNLPGSNIRMIHVAGTNGKGSVSYKIASGFILSHYKVGLFSSPHLLSVRERITINHKPISKQIFCTILHKLFTHLEINNQSLNFFEVLFLLCLQYFEKEKVNVAVIETGLGGRLDATNIIEPFFTLITSISHDHTHILGNTLEEIAKEKAGIIKKNVPLVLGPTANMSVILKIAQEKEAKTFLVEPALSSFDEENSSIACRALKQMKKSFLLSDEAIKRAIQTKPRCRMEIFEKKDLLKKFAQSPKTVVFDVAHNEAGVKSLFKALQNKFQKDQFSIILGFSKQKDIQKCLKIIIQYATYIYLAKSQHPRLEHAEVLQKDLEALGFHAFKVFPSYEDAFSSAMKIEEKTLLVCGSFYMMDSMYRQIFNDQDQDVWNLTENMI